MGAPLNKSCKSFLGNKEQKVIFLVVSRSDVQFGFDQSFFACPIGLASKTVSQKVGCLERNLSTPDYFHKNIYERKKDS